MTKEYGIGYTIFEFDGRTKRPIEIQKVYPGNIGNEVKKLEARIAKMNGTYKLHSLAFAAMLWGSTVRLALEVIH